MRLVLVEWEDAASGVDLSWEDPSAPLIERCLVRTVGFVRREDAQAVELCMSYHDEQIAGRWMIPRGCIVRIIDLPTDNQSSTPPAR
jgi:hypothetical protein